MANNASDPYFKLRQALATAFLMALFFGAIYLWESRSKPAPSVFVKGIHADVVTFGRWTRDGSYLRSDMTLQDRPNAAVVGDITYATFDSSGVKLDEGPVEHPSMKRGETARASVLIQNDAAAKVVVDVD